jgi:hypothetical protein
MKKKLIELSLVEMRTFLETKLDDIKIISVVPREFTAKPAHNIPLLGATPLPIKDFIVSKFLVIYEE